MSRKQITERLSAILEDIFGVPMMVPMRSEFEAFFEPDEYNQFTDLVVSEFDLEDPSLIDGCSTFLELVVLLEDELFSENY